MNYENDFNESLAIFLLREMEIVQKIGRTFFSFRYSFEFSGLVIRN